MLQVLANSLKPPEITNPDRPNALSPSEDSQALPAKPRLQATQDHCLAFCLEAHCVSIFFLSTSDPGRASAKNFPDCFARFRQISALWVSPTISALPPGQARIHKWAVALTKKGPM